MKLLAISTSGPSASAALFEDGELTAQRISPEGPTHSETVMGLVDELLSSRGLNPSDIDRFAADTGPGSFTGVRIGVSLVNAMGFALGKPVCGVSSLDAMAYGLSGSVCALLDRRNTNVYAALYLDSRAVIPPRADTLDGFLKDVPEGTLFTGDVQVFHDRILSAVPLARFDSTERLTAANTGFAAMAIAPCESIAPTYLVISQAERLKKKAN